MKKYLAILLTIAMAACTTDPTTGGGNEGQLGDGGGINVPDNNTGYYPTAKIFTGFGDVLTNEDPIRSTFAPGANVQNSIANSIGSRIPSMIVLPSGRIVISGDVRWTGNGDLPHKTDNFSRYSDDNGTNWSPVKMIHKFNDFDTDTFANIISVSSGTDKSEGQIKIGAAAADAAIGRAKDGTLIAIATAGAHSTGSHDTAYGAGVANHSAYKTFNNKTYLMLREKPAVNINDFSISSSGAQSTGSTREQVPVDDAQFKYGIEVNTTETESKTVRQLQEFTFSGTDIATTKDVAGVYIDEKLYVWNNAAGTDPIMVKQLGTKTINKIKKYEELTKTTQAHLFYVNSPYWPFRAYTHVTMSRSKNNGETWDSQANIITPLVRKNADNKFLAGMFFVSPTAGYLKRFGNNKGRLFFSAYSSAGEERPMIFWTDDAGKTWDSANDFVQWGDNVTTSSETAMIEAPDGTLIIVSRAAGTGAGASYATSKDSGKNWTKSLMIPKSEPSKPGLDAIAANQLSAVNLSQWKGLNGEALVAFSHASEQLGWDRSNGKITIAALVKDETNPERGWTFDFAFLGALQSINYTDLPSKHDYSVVVEKLDGNLGVYYEGQRVFRGGAGGMALDFNTVEMKGQ